MPGLSQGLGDPVRNFSSPLRGGLRWGLFNQGLETPVQLKFRLHFEPGNSFTLFSYE